MKSEGLLVVRTLSAAGDVVGVVRGGVGGRAAVGAGSTVRVSHCSLRELSCVRMDELCVRPLCVSGRGLLRWFSLLFSLLFGLRQRNARDPVTIRSKKAGNTQITTVHRGRENG